MGDLLKDLARTRPATPDVDPERMERDLARIVALPRSSFREWSGAPTFLRRFVPVLVATAVVALVVVLVPSDRAEQMGTAATQKWHVLSRLASLVVVGDAKNPYVLRLSSETDKWLAAADQITISQLSGSVAPYAQDDVRKWEAAGRPEQARQVGGDHDVRIGPMRPAVSKTDDAEFSISAHHQFRFDELDALPSNPSDLLSALDELVSKHAVRVNHAYQTAMLTMGIMSANVRPDQRNAALELLKWHNRRDLGTVTLPNGRTGVGTAVPAPPTSQFTDVETQLVFDPQTNRPIMIRHVITTPQHGLAAGTSISEEEFVFFEETSAEPILPADVIVNGEVESPIIER